MPFTKQQRKQVRILAGDRGQFLKDAEIDTLADLRAFTNKDDGLTYVSLADVAIDYINRYLVRQGAAPPQNAAEVKSFRDVLNKERTANPAKYHVRYLKGDTPVPASQSARLLPIGGTTGQVLKKESDDDYDADWEDDTGRQGPQGKFDITIHQAAATKPTRPTGGTYNLDTGAFTPPTGWVTDIPDAGAGQEIWAARAPIDPATQSGEVVPVWSLVYEVGSIVSVGGLTGPQVDARIQTHNTAGDSHADIRTDLDTETKARQKGDADINARIDSLPSPVPADGSITTDKLADGAVTTPKLANDSVSSRKLQAEAVTEAIIADGAVTGLKIPRNTITEGHIAADAVGASEVRANAIGTDELQNGAVTEAKLDSGVQTKLNDRGTGGASHFGDMFSGTGTEVDPIELELVTGDLANTNRAPSGQPVDPGLGLAPARIREIESKAPQAELDAHEAEPHTTAAEKAKLAAIPAIPDHTSEVKKYELNVPADSGAATWTEATGGGGAGAGTAEQVVNVTSTSIVTSTATQLATFDLALEEDEVVEFYITGSVSHVDSASRDSTLDITLTPEVSRITDPVILGEAGTQINAFVNRNQSANFHNSFSILAHTKKTVSFVFTGKGSGAGVGLTSFQVYVIRASHGGGGGGGGLDQAAVDARIRDQVEKWAIQADADDIPGSKTINGLTRSESQAAIPAANARIAFNVGDASDDNVVDETDAEDTSFNITAQQAAEANALLRVRWTAGGTQVKARPTDVELLLRIRDSGEVLGKHNLPITGTSQTGTAKFPITDAGAYQWAVRVVTKGNYTGEIIIEEATYHSSQALIEPFIEHVVHPLLSAEKEERQSVEKKLQEDVDKANEGSFPKVNNVQRKTAIVWDTTVPYRQTAADALQAPGTGYVKLILGNIAETGIMPVEYCINRKNIVYAVGSGANAHQISINWDSQRRAIIEALGPNNTLSSLASDIAGTATGLVMLHWNVVRDASTDTGSPSWERVLGLQDTLASSRDQTQRQVIGQLSLPRASYPQTFEISGIAEVAQNDADDDIRNFVCHLSFTSTGDDVHTKGGDVIGAAGTNTEVLMHHFYSPGSGGDDDVYRATTQPQDSNIRVNRQGRIAEQSHVNTIRTINVASGSGTTDPIYVWGELVGKVRNIRLFTRVVAQ